MTTTGTESGQQAIALLEGEATEMEARLGKLREIIAALRSLSGTPAVATSGPLVSGRVPLSGYVGTIAQEAHRLLQETGPLHTSDIVDRLRARGVRLPDDRERARRNFVGAVFRRKDLIHPTGGGIYAATVAEPVERPKVKAVGTLKQRGSASVGGVRQKNGAAPRGFASNLLTEIIEAHPEGLSFDNLADLAVPQLQTVTKADNPRKLVHSVLGYLIDKGRARRDGGSIYALSRRNGANDDSGRTPELALDR